MSLITPDIGLLFWMALVFAVVFAVLGRWAFPFIGRMITRRSDTIAESLHKADEIDRRLEGLSAEMDGLMAEAKKKEAMIIYEARRSADDILREARDRAEEESKRRMEELARQVEAEKANAIRGIRKEVAALSVEVAGKILRARFDDGAGERAFADTLVEEAERNMVGPATQGENRQS